LDWADVNRWVANAFDHWSVVIYTFLIILAVLAINAVLNRAMAAMARREHADGHVWRGAFLIAGNPPLRGAVWIAGLSAAAGLLMQQGRLSLLAQVFPPARDVAVVAIAAWFLFRTVAELEQNFQRRALLHPDHEVDQTAVDAIGKLVRAAILITATLVAMQTLGFSISGLIAFGGIGGIALGFAAQGLVANLLGGITIYASRPFKVGDHIIFPGTTPTGYIGWQAGEVQHIGWRATRILDWNGKPFYVPNAKFNTETIINHSRMSFREVSQYIYIRLEDIDAVPGIVEDVNRMLEGHPEMGDYLVFRFDSYGEYALKLYLYAYTAGTITAYTEYMRVKQDLLLKIGAIIKEHGAKLAVPVSHVYLPDGLTLPEEYEASRAIAASPGMTRA
jgi:MscS family membrane protein